jgi:PAS domain S-box-containing protein
MSKKGRYFSLLIVFCAGIFLSISAFRLAYNGETARVKIAFDEAAANRVKYIEDTIGDAVDILGSFGDLYSASEEVTKEEFDTFAQGIFRRKPYIFEFRWLKRVSASERKEFEQAMRREGLSDFIIYDLGQGGSKTEAESRSEHIVILYNSVSPKHIPEHTLITGLDVTGIPERWQALQIARDTAEISATRETKQYEEEPVSSAFRLFLPVYRNNTPNNTLPERKENLIGFVALLYKIDELVEYAIKGAPLVGVDITIYETSSGINKTLYVRPARTRKEPVIDLGRIEQDAEKGNYFTYRSSFDIANQKWLLVCNPAPYFYARHKIIFPWVILAVSIFITLILTFYLLTIVNRTNVIERLVKERTEELRKAEERFRVLYEASQDAVMTLAPPEWKFSAGNPATIRLFGAKDEEEFISKGPEELSPEYQPGGELSSDKARAMIEVALEKGVNFFEWTHKKLGGEEFFATVLLSRVELGGERFIQATVRDITEAKKKEQEFQRLNDFNTTILKTLPFPMDIVDEDGNIMFLSEKMQAVAGKDALGKKCWSIYRDDKAQCRDCPLMKGIRVGETAAIEAEDVFGGKVFEISHTGMVFQGEKAVLEIFEDITERKKAEKQITELFRAVEQSPVCVVITDINGNIEYVNPKFLQLTGYAFKEVLGQNPRVLKSGEQPLSFYKELWDTILSGKEWRGEFHNKKKSGELYWELASISPIRDKDGGITNFIAVKEDITERKHIEDSLKKAYQTTKNIIDNAPFGIYIVNESGDVEYVNMAMLNIAGATNQEFMSINVFNFSPYQDIGLTEKIRIGLEGKYFRLDAVEYTSRFGKKNTVRNFFGIPLVEEGKRKVIVIVEDITERKRLEKLKDEFVSTVSHELRTPLSIVKEGISLILDKVPGEINEKQDKILNTANNNIDRLTRIINDLLNISKIESGRMELRKQEFDLTALIEQEASLFRKQAEERGLQLKLNLPDKHVQALADPDRINEVLINLINNSLKFTDKGYIEVSLKEDDSVIECSVADTGIGISEDDLPKVFNKFEQFHRLAGGGPKGTGLGLSISKGIIEMHHGKMWVESKFGEGTKFVFTLPRQNNPLEI